MRPIVLSLFCLLATKVTALRFAMYIDSYHLDDLPGTNRTQEISHAIMAFADSTIFNNDSPKLELFEPVKSMRKRFSSNAKVLLAIGGWGGSGGFSEGAKNQTSRGRYAQNIANMLDKEGLDGVDIDWEYPGGNGADYKQKTNAMKQDEIEKYPLLLAAIRAAIGKDKVLSIAVPGKREDMLAFTKAQGPKIWPLVDMVNIMTYDLMNRRDTVTRHHSSVQDSLNSILAYKDIGLDGDKINLGIAYYAKWFKTDSNMKCDMGSALGCITVPMENDDGSDNHQSGVATFEKSFLSSPPEQLKDATSGGRCGFQAGARCPSGQCCSQSGYCGSTDDHCKAGCLSDYGKCEGFSVGDSFRRALRDGRTDKEAGGQYYLDTSQNVFWTWDTPKTIERKFKEIVDQKKVGGVMAWSLGLDTFRFEHLQAMQNAIKERQ